jgi:16S rRNA (uracil1498-N3)-methyltransferase
VGLLAGGAVRRVLARDLGSAEIALDPAGSWYLVRVLRLAVGDPVVAFDGEGTEVEAHITSASEVRAILRATGPARAARADSPLVLCLALPKGPAMDLAVRMATELGATDIRPVLAARSVATGDRVERWIRIAEAAARQCGRADLPAIRVPTDLAGSLAAVPPDLTRWVATPGADDRGAPGPAAVWIGPEGGWTADELAVLVGAGCAPLSLGPWVLRVDTAFAAALGRRVG